MKDRSRLSPEISQAPHAAVSFFKTSSDTNVDTLGIAPTFGAEVNRTGGLPAGDRNANPG